jgi:hypothetical protein
MVKSLRVSYQRLSPFARGVIFGLFLAGCPVVDIPDKVVKKDGQHPSLQAVCDTIASCQKNGVKWDGAAGCSTGRPKLTAPALDRKIVRLVFKHRGSAKVTTGFIRKAIKAARKVSQRTLARRLCDAGLAWLRRRRKTLVTQE